MINFNQQPTRSPNTLQNPNSLRNPRDKSYAIGHTTYEIYLQQKEKLGQAQQNMNSSYSKVYGVLDDTQKKALEIAKQTAETAKNQFENSK